MTDSSLSTRVPARALASALAIVLAGGCGDSELERELSRAGDDAADATPTAITWTACTDREFQGGECGTIAVPIDWRDADGPRAQLSLVRRPADPTLGSLGTLFLNNAGGGSSIEQLRFALASGVPLGDLSRFDIVAVDLRGIGRSSAVQCGRPQRARTVSYFPTDEGGFDRLVRDNQALHAACRERTGPLLDHLDLESMARDLDAVRHALGEAQISFYGIHFSSLLGRTYAELFPERVRLLILDTVLDDASRPKDRVLSEARALEDSFTRFAAWCQRTPAVPDAQDPRAGGCALHGQDVSQLFERVAQRAEASGLRVPGAEAFRAEDVRHAPQEHLVQTMAWPLFSRAIQQALGGDGALLAANADNTLDALQDHAISCANTPPAATRFAELSALAEEMRALAPHTHGATRAYRTAAGCIGWPNRPPHVERRSLTDPPPTLIVQSTHHCLTTYESAAGLSYQLPGSVVLGREGDDYSMYLFSRCVAEDFDAFLVHARSPVAGKVCTD